MDTPRGLGRSAANVAATYGAWIVTSVLGVGVFITWHTALLHLYVGRFNRYGTAAYNNTVVIALVLIWLVLVMALEGWYRRAASAGALGRLFVRVTLVQVVLWALGFVVGRLA
jgi:hypothetical protein